MALTIACDNCGNSYNLDGQVSGLLLESNIAGQITVFCAEEDCEEGALINLRKNETWLTTYRGNE